MSPNERMERGSESVFDEQESAYQQDGESYDDEVEILVDEALYRSSEFPDEPPDEEEAQAASDDRGQHEHAEIDVEYSAARVKVLYGIGVKPAVKTAQKFHCS